MQNILGYRRKYIFEHDQKRTDVMNTIDISCNDKLVIAQNIFSTLFLN